MSMAQQSFVAVQFLYKMPSFHFTTKTVRKILNTFGVMQQCSFNNRYKNISVLSNEYGSVSILACC